MNPDITLHDWGFQKEIIGSAVQVEGMAVPSPVNQTDTSNRGNLFYGPVQLLNNATRVAGQTDAFLLFN